MEYKIGDLVKLRSGGATMVVEACGSELITCVWQNRTSGGWEAKSSSYPAAVLRHDGAGPPAATGGPASPSLADDPGYKVYEEGDD